MILKPPKGILLNRNHLLARGLVMACPLNSGNGSGILDHSGNGLSITATGATWVASRRGPALNFDGNDYLTIANHSKLSAEQMAVVLLVRTSTAGVAWTGTDWWTGTWLVDRDVPGVGNAGWAIVLGSSNSHIVFITRDDATAESATNIADGQSHVVVCTRDGKNKYVYIDGRLEDTAADTGVISNSQPMYVGSEKGTGKYWTGVLDGLFYYNRFLSLAEAQTLYRDPFAMFRRPRLELWTAAQPVSLPSKATTPSPADAAPNVALATTLSWVDGGGAATFNVYLDTVSPPVTEVSHAQAGNTYDPGGLLASTTYYWRIDSTNPAGTTTGDEWSFTTAAAGGLKCHPGMGGGINA